MPDCGCQEARQNLEDYLHGELPQVNCGDLEEHLAACPPCQDEHTVGLMLTQKVKSACCETAPDELKATIVTSLDSAL